MNCISTLEREWRQQKTDVSWMCLHCVRLNRVDWLLWFCSGWGLSRQCHLLLTGEPHQAQVLSPVSAYSRIHHLCGPSVLLLALQCKVWSLFPHGGFAHRLEKDVAVRKLWAYSTGPPWILHPDQPEQHFIHPAMMKFRTKGRWHP